MTEVEQQLEQLTETIRRGEIYQEMKEAYRELKKDPELMEKANEFRRKRFLLQVSGVAGCDQSRELREYRDRHLRDSRAVRFLKAELEYCRLMRRVTRDLYENMDLDLDFLEDVAR